MKKLLIALGLLPLAFILFAASGPPYTPINKGRLQSNLNGNGYAITNLGEIRATNFTDAVTGLPLETGVGGALTNNEVRAVTLSSNLVVAGTITGNLSGGSNVNVTTATGTLSPDRVTATFSNLPIYYVDSANGSDANHGRTPQSAWQTLARLSNTLDSVEIRLARGSHWREQLSPSTNCVVTDYGEGPRPIINAADVATNNLWTFEGSTTNVYKYTWVCGDAGASTWLGVQEDGTPLRYTNSIIECAQTPGTFFTTNAAGPATGSTNIIFVHPRNSTSPISDGKLYEVAKRFWAVGGPLAQRVKISNLVARNALGNSGPVYLINDCEAYNVLAENGNKHNFYIASGVAKDCVAWKQEFGGVDASFFISFGYSGKKMSYINCVAAGTPELFGYAANGFFAHVGAGGSDGYSEMLYDNCTVQYAMAFGSSGVGSNGVAVYNQCKSIGNSGGFTAYTGTNIFIDCESLPAPTVADSTGALISSVGNNGNIQVTGCKSHFATGLFLYASTNWMVDVKSSAFVGRLFSGSSSNVVLSAHNSIFAGYDLAAGATLSSAASNVVTGGITIDGTAYGSFTAYTNANPTLDVYSVNTGLEYLGEPTLGDWRVSTTSTAIPRRAGPGFGSSPKTSKASLISEVLPAVPESIVGGTNIMGLLGKTPYHTNLLFSTDAVYNIGEAANYRPLNIYSRLNYAYDFFAEHRVYAADLYAWSIGSAVMKSPNDTDITLNNWGQTGFGTLSFGGRSAAFPGLKQVNGDLVLTDGLGATSGPTNRLMGNIGGNGGWLSNVVHLIAGTGINLTTNLGPPVAWTLTAVSTNLGSATNVFVYQGGPDYLNVASNAPGDYTVSVDFAPQPASENLTNWSAVAVSSIPTLAGANVFAATNQFARVVATNSAVLTNTALHGTTTVSGALTALTFIGAHAGDGSGITNLAHLLYTNRVGQFEALESLPGGTLNVFDKILVEKSTGDTLGYTLLGAVKTLIVPSTIGDLESYMSGVNIVTAPEVDTSAELAGILTDELGNAGKFILADVTSHTAGDVLVWDGSKFTNAPFGSAVTVAAGTNGIAVTSSGGNYTVHDTGVKSYLSVTGQMDVTTMYVTNFTALSGISSTKDNKAQPTIIMLMNTNTASISWTNTTAVNQIYYISGGTNVTVGVNELLTVFSWPSYIGNATVLLQPNEWLVLDYDSNPQVVRKAF